MGTLEVLLLVAVVVLVMVTTDRKFKWSNWFGDSDPKGPDVEAVSQSIHEEVTRRVVEEFLGQLDAVKNLEELSAQKLKLESELAALKREKDNLQGDFDRKLLDLEHKAGMLRKELDAELRAAKGAYELDAEKRVLAVEKEFQTTQMKFSEERFKSQIEQVDKTLSSVLERLPNVNTRIKLEGKA